MMPETPKLSLDSKYISAGLAAIGVVALAAAGFVNISTPGEEECREDMIEVKAALSKELTDIKVDHASCTTRVELLGEAKDACKDALQHLTSDTHP
jgi:hypothetical protein